MCFCYWERERIKGKGFLLPLSKIRHRTEQCHLRRMDTDDNQSEKWKSPAVASFSLWKSIARFCEQGNYLDSGIRCSHSSAFESIPFPIHNISQWIANWTNGQRSGSIAIWRKRETEPLITDTINGHPPFWLHFMPWPKTRPIWCIVHNIYRL